MMPKPQSLAMASCVSVLQSLDALILSPERGNGWVLDFGTSFHAAFLDSTLVNSHITLRS